ncbi:chemotaxis response regulator protein-glutamate methylesterase [Pokkaliibacter sp. MBI-7]|uniref:protein-glutamate methylesterase/protein-glutamine glutaminase n=1 Tax=Pokkaliibacter sp. MBI-7 TaxID=3040600 RepID=UPI00244977E9|nr:chemotaxis response regulator protein-glutamate methylesterase [Pokkaliibacter sp. MBI-7]MDH2431244.1 chemotaxis response regulator protein-glutamate methylesterase [Pokkaliibacter sp. MBI-7]
MPITVLVVDDSAFFRRRLTEILEADPRFKVIGTAENGRAAIDKTLELRPDVITMDYEMPTLDGISAVNEIMRRRPTPVLMFSSMTYEGARITLQALEAGAVDYMPKNFEDLSRNRQAMESSLRDKLYAVAKSRRVTLKSAVTTPELRTTPAVPSFRSTRTEEPARSTLNSTNVAPPAPQQPIPARPSASVVAKRYQLVAIGTSTGGPVALQEVLTRLPADFPSPIVLIQHMPAAFTKAFAERLNQLCKIQVKEAEDGDELRPGLALLAPGGKQMMVEHRGTGRVRILPGDERLNYKPCVDVTFGSAAKHYPGKVLALVLTGMGADGREGARMLKQSGSDIWAQSEQSCVIYGMPMAIVKAGLADEIVDLDEIGVRLSKAVKG